ncbi:hypothetical protein JK191_14065 [Gluconobacter sphaericus]|uniref:hypothetical protein n=1 Tax=Gluconobacter sphaericus TaxID=574987 RepID=UPI001B8DA7BB|nr:hypothetical protein [Gluconobacter sphaericus]MBS1098642.1 hypothetical protein [Gluconobacter sphaericus]
MIFEFTDFNNSYQYFSTHGKKEWDDISNIISNMPLFLQPSQQAGIVGEAIFDPKATNDYLTTNTHQRGWRTINVPPQLQMFGKHWDGGNNGTLAEWQFSNYPFLWNNIIRTEAVIYSNTNLNNSVIPKALIIVTKSGMIPSSNSTLYYEQALAQISSVTNLNVFKLPIRLIGLVIPTTLNEIDAVWTEYPSRYCREGRPITSKFHINRGRSSFYGHSSIKFVLPR